jgi:Icc-related predicted phosphoesterase
VTRILAVADEVDEALYADKLDRLRPELVLSCGDLPFDYLEYIVSRANVPLIYVPGNHDPGLAPADTTWTAAALEPLPGPQGCDNADGRVLEVLGLRIGGLGGSIRYRPGPNQYTEAQMRRRALALEVRVRLKRVPRGRKLDILLTHAPPFGGGPPADPAHVGFAAFNRVYKVLAPAVHFHGHVHLYGRSRPERWVGDTRIINAVPSRLIEI